MKRQHLFTAAVLIVAIGALGVMAYKKMGSGAGIRFDDKYVYVDGTVTAYDLTPSFSDGNIIFDGLLYGFFYAVVF